MRRTARICFGWGTLAALWALPAAQAVVLDRLEASVNSALILKTDVSKFRTLLGLRSQLDPLFATTPLAQKQASATDAEIINFLIDEKLITSLFSVSDSDVEQAISAIVTSNRTDRDALKEALRSQGFSFDDYFEQIRIGKAKHDLIDREIRMKISVSEDDIRNYYTNHYARQAGEAVSHQLQLIFVALKTYKTPQLARQAAQRALDAIRGGEAFEEVAKRSSDDPNASNGGDLGMLGEDSMNPALLEQVRKLKVGEVSEIFGSDKTGGYSIVKVVDRKSTDSERFNKLKDEIRNQLAATEYQRQVQLWLERQRQRSFIRRSGDPTITAMPVS